MLQRISTPPGKNTMTQAEWQKTALWAAGVIFGVLGSVWGFATAFADLQDEAEVEKMVAPVAAVAAAADSKADKTAIEVAGIKADISGMQKNQTRTEDKVDALLLVTLESAEYQREAAPQGARPRAKRRAAARAARVRTEAAADDGDPLGALEDPR